jgi:hypothetical protein
MGDKLMSKSIIKTSSGFKLRDSNKKDTIYLNKNSFQELKDNRNSDYVFNGINFESESGLPQSSLKTLETLKRYKGISEAVIVSKGMDYPYSTHINMPEPDHPDGEKPTADIYFGLTYNSLNISGTTSYTNVPTDYHTYYLNPLTESEEKLPAKVLILFDSEGAVQDFVLIDSGSGFDNSGFSVTRSSEIISGPTVELYSLRENSLQINFIPNKFTITKLEINSFGSGYLWHKSDGHAKFRNISLSNSGSGYGFYGYFLQDDKYIPSINEENEKYNEKLSRRFGGIANIKFKDSLSIEAIKNPVTHTEESESSIAASQDDNDQKCNTDAISSPYQKAEFTLFHPLMLIPAAIPIGTAIGLAIHNKLEKKARAAEEVLRKAVERQNILRFFLEISENASQKRQIVLHLLTQSSQDRIRIDNPSLPRGLGDLYHYIDYEVSLGGQQVGKTRIPAHIETPYLPGLGPNGTVILDWTPGNPQQPPRFDPALGGKSAFEVQSNIRSSEQRALQTLKKFVKQQVLAQITDITRYNLDCNLSLQSGNYLTSNPVIDAQFYLDQLKEELEAKYKLAKKSPKFKLPMAIDINAIDLGIVEPDNVLQVTKEEAIQWFKETREANLRNKILDEHRKAILEGIEEAKKELERIKPTITGKICRVVSKVGQKGGVVLRKIKPAGGVCLKWLGRFGVGATIWNIASSESYAQLIYTSVEAAVDYSPIGTVKFLLEIFEDSLPGSGEPSTILGSKSVLKSRLEFEIVTQMRAAIKLYLIGENYRKSAQNYRQAAALGNLTEQEISDLLAKADEIENEASVYPSKETLGVIYEYLFTYNNGLFFEKYNEELTNLYNKSAQEFLDRGINKNDITTGSQEQIINILIEKSVTENPSIIYYLDLDPIGPNPSDYASSLEVLDISSRVYGGVYEDWRDRTFGPLCSTTEEGCVNFCKKEDVSDLLKRIELFNGEELQIGGTTLINGNKKIIDFIDEDNTIEIPKDIKEAIRLGSKRKDYREFLEIVDESSKSEITNEFCIDKDCCGTTTTTTLPPVDSDLSGSGLSGPYNQSYLKYYFNADSKTWIID